MLVLSLFPGIGLLDRAFEEEGFQVLRGPDELWGGDIRGFHPPGGIFRGIIGGPPCQSHSTFAALNRAQGKYVREDLVPEFVRCVEEEKPDWFVMENSPGVPDISPSGYEMCRPLLLNARWFGCEQDRMRKWQFGCKWRTRFEVDTVALEPIRREPVCMASEGRSGRITTVKVDGKPRSRHKPRREWTRFCELQGLPADFDLPCFTNEWKYRVVGNGVPLPMGRAIARAVKEAVCKSSQTMSV